MDASDIAELAKDNEVYVDATEKKSCDYDVPLGTGRHGQLLTCTERFEIFGSTLNLLPSFGFQKAYDDTRAAIYSTYNLWSVQADERYIMLLASSS